VTRILVELDILKTFVTITVNVKDMEGLAVRDIVPAGIYN
jgi:hypothetical protein